jgi:predicted lipoprotein with Yx(FWY)xxD motif
MLPAVLAVVAAVGATMAATAATGASKPTVRAAAGTTLGTMLVGPNGRTLYRYTRDRKRVDTCTKNAVCAKLWPRLLVKAGTKPTAGPGVKASLLGTIEATKTKSQVTYAGWPLYYFSADKGAGQAKGEGFQNEWYVVNTKGALVKHAAATSPAPAPAPTTTAPAAGDGGAGGGEAWG